MIALTVVSFMMSTALRLFTKNYGTKYALPYFIMIGVTGLLSFISMFISMALPTEKFDYSDRTINPTSGLCPADPEQNI